MKHWLRVAGAEFIRDLQLARRYPMEIITGMFIMYVIFMGIFLGGKNLAGGHLATGSLEMMVVSFCMWFFALMAMNQMSVDIETEARAGTLEQVYLCSGSYFTVLWIRALTHMSQGAVAVVFFSLLLQFSTGKHLHMNAADILPAAFVLLVSVAGLCGFGLILGGISLLVKRIGQASAILQFGMLFLVNTDLRGLAAPWNSILPHLPLGRGAGLMKMLLVPEYGRMGFGAELLWLVADSVFYILLGSAVYLWAERIARRGGMLAHQ